MNSSYGKPNNKTNSNNAFDFDLGLSSGRSRPMNDQKNQSLSYTPAYPKSNSTTWTTSRPAAPVQSNWTGSLSGPTSMVGDIFGKSWNSSSTGSGIGVVNNKDPNLFGDLLTSAMGQQSKIGGGNAPLKNANTGGKPFSMGGMADSLPKSSNPGGVNAGLGGNYAQNSNIGGGGIVNSGASYGHTSTPGGGNVNFGGNSNRSTNLGGPSLKNMSGSGLGGSGIGTGKDPFESLGEFGSKPRVSVVNSDNKVGDQSGSGNNSFGDFQNAAPKPANEPSFSSSAFPTNSFDPLNDFGFSSSVSQNQSQPAKQSSGSNDFDGLFSSSSGGASAMGGGGVSTQQIPESDDWEFGGANDANGTTEIEGLPPPPAGVSAPSAKNKGMENYKQGQFADAIKWLSWAVILLEKAGDDDGTMEALSSRASCYKEVGEYKKAVADCTKVLEHDEKNVSVLVQRALLYESMEKYKLGAEDLRTVMKLDPGNRIARSTIHRLTKMAG